MVAKFLHSIPSSTATTAAATTTTKAMAALATTTISSTRHLIAHFTALFCNQIIIRRRALFPLRTLTHITKNPLLPFQLTLN
ncbi:hypothetical protein ACS0TY_023688 [Phlomoides rotata]